MKRNIIDVQNCDMPVKTAFAKFKHRGHPAGSAPKQIAAYDLTDLKHGIGQKAQQPGEHHDLHPAQNPGKIRPVPSPNLPNLGFLEIFDHFDCDMITVNVLRCQFLSIGMQCG